MIWKDGIQIACLLLMPLALKAASNQWIQGASGEYRWSDGDNWEGGNRPSSATDTVVAVLSNSAYLSAGFLQISLNDGGPLTLNRLIPRGTGPSSGWATNVVRGDAITFDGTTPAIDYDHRSNFVYIPEKDPVLNKTLQVQTTGNDTPLDSLISSGTHSGVGWVWSSPKECKSFVRVTAEFF